MSSMSNTSCKTFLLDNKLLERKEGGGEEGVSAQKKDELWAFRHHVLFTHWHLRLEES